MKPVPRIDLKHCRIHRTYQNISFGVLAFVRDFDEIKNFDEFVAVVSSMIANEHLLPYLLSMGICVSHIRPRKAWPEFSLWATSSSKNRIVLVRLVRLGSVRFFFWGWTVPQRKSPTAKNPRALEKAGAISNLWLKYVTEINILREKASLVTDEQNFFVYYLLLYFFQQTSKKLSIRIWS